MLQLLPMDESDLYAYQNIFAEAFKDTLMVMMYPNGYSEEDKQFGINVNLEKWREDPEHIKMMKVIDTDLPIDDVTGNIVGVARWEFHPQERTPEELESEKQDQSYATRPLAPGANVAFFREFIKIIAECKTEVLGRQAYATLSVLATLPSYYRRGIGAMHMDWGLKEADKLGLQTFIEATPMGRPLYDRYGFEEILPVPLDAKKWGIPYDFSIVCMVRPARSISNGSHSPTNLGETARG